MIKTLRIAPEQAGDVCGIEEEYALSVAYVSRADASSPLKSIGQNDASSRSNDGGVCANTLRRLGTFPDI